MITFVFPTKRAIFLYFVGNPLLEDSEGKILSMPPIINSEDTKVTLDTKTIFIDVTALEEKIAIAALNVLVTSIADRGASIESVEVVYPDKQIITPDLKPIKIELHLNITNRILGLKLTMNKLLELLSKMRMDSKSLNNDLVEVVIPPYRSDFLHEIDLIEDVSIAYGYDKIEPELPPFTTIGREMPLETFMRKIRDLMIGFGFQEITNYIMTNKETLFHKMDLPEEPVVEVENPRSEAHSVLRNQLLPCLLEFLSKNLHVPYPQKIFEVGDVTIIDEMAENKAKEIRKLAAAISDGETSFEDIQSVAYGILWNLNIKNYRFEEHKNHAFINGRAANILVNEEPIGIIGEVHPKVLLNFRLQNPTVAMEINVEKILKFISAAVAQPGRAPDTKCG